MNFEPTIDSPLGFVTERILRDETDPEAIRRKVTAIYKIIEAMS